MDCSTPGFPDHHQPWNLLKLMSIESVTSSRHLILCCSLLLLLSIFPSIRVFSNESFLPIRWPKYWSFSFSINPFNDYSRLISFKIDCFYLLGPVLSKILMTTDTLEYFYCDERKRFQRVLLKDGANINGLTRFSISSHLCANKLDSFRSAYPWESFKSVAHYQTLNIVLWELASIKTQRIFINSNTFFVT